MLIIAQIIGTVGVGVAPTIGVLVAEEVTSNEAWAGLARTASTLGAAIFGIWLGTVAARRGRRVALATGWLTAASGSALLVFAAQQSLIVPLFVGLLLIGAGSAASLQSRFAATDLAEPQSKARSLALVVWVGTIGSVLGPNLGVPGKIVGSATGLNVFSSSFLIAGVFLALAGVVIFFTLRPDPLLTLEQSTHRSAARPRTGFTDRLRQAKTEIQTNELAKTAVIAIVTAQIVMVAIMTMTPIHISHQGGSIELVGITISLHVAGMYALAPLVGWITDKAGHRASITVGILVLMASLVMGVFWPEDMNWLVANLILLGVGWSFINVAGSALFSAVVPAETRAASQGGVDAMSNLSGATAAFLAGPLLALTNFSVLSVLGMVFLIPLSIIVATRKTQFSPTSLVGTVGD